MQISSSHDCRWLLGCSTHRCCATDEIGPEQGPVCSCSEAVISNQPPQPSLASWWVAFWLTSESHSATSVKGGQPLWRSLLCLEMCSRLRLACLQNWWVAQDEEKRKAILPLPAWPFLLGDANQWLDLLCLQWELQHLMHVETPSVDVVIWSCLPPPISLSYRERHGGTKGWFIPTCYLGEVGWVTVRRYLSLCADSRGHPECQLRLDTSYYRDKIRWEQSFPCSPLNQVS